MKNKPYNTPVTISLVASYSKNYQLYSTSKYTTLRFLDTPCIHRQQYAIKHSETRRHCMQHTTCKQLEVLRAMRDTVTFGWKLSFTLPQSTACQSEPCE